MRRPLRHATIGTMNTLLRIVLLLWVVGYLFVSCAPILDGHLLLGAVTFVGGIILFVPWVLGIVVLAALIRMTNPPAALGDLAELERRMEPGRREVVLGRRAAVDRRTSPRSSSRTSACPMTGRMPVLEERRRVLGRELDRASSGGCAARAGASPRPTPAGWRPS